VSEHSFKNWITSFFLLSRFGFIKRPSSQVSNLYSIVDPEPRGFLKAYMTTHLRGDGEFNINVFLHDL